MTKEEVIIPEMNLKNIIAESREVAQALNEFADELERIEKKYADPQKSEEEKEVTDAIVAKPSCYYCEYEKLNMADGSPCHQCYLTDNRPNFKPNARYMELYEKIKDGMDK